MQKPRLHRAFRRIGLLLIFEFATAAAALGQATEDLKVDCLVTDGEGKPLAGVELGDHWSSSDGLLTPGMLEAGPVLVSDSNGRVQGSWTCSYGRPLLALTPDRKLVARIRGISDAVRGTIVLQPALEITARLELPAGPEPRQPAGLYIGWVRGPRPQEKEGPLYEAWVSAEAGWQHECDGRMRLFIPRSPTHRYKLTIHHPSFGDHYQSYSFTIAPEVGAFDLGTLGVPFDLTAGSGQLLPDWNPCEARGVPLKFSLPYDFAGQPLVVVLRRFPRETDKPRDDTAERSLLATLAAHPRRGEFRVLLLQRDAGMHTRGTVASTEPLDVTVVTDLTTIAERVFEGAGLAVLLDRSGWVSHLVREETDLLEALARELGPVAEENSK